MTPPGEPRLMLAVSEPPYRALQPILASSRQKPPLGSVIAIAVRRSAGAAIPLARTIPDVRVRFPTAPIVLWITGPLSPAAIRLARQAGALGARGVICGDEPIEAALRQSLPHPSRLGLRVVEWLGLRGYDPRSSPSGFLRSCFDREPAPLRLGDVLTGALPPARTLGYRLGAAGLPGPGAWVSLARGIRAALSLQGDPDRPLARAAWDAGYADQAALSHHLHRLFRLRPGRIRRLLGWEWLLDRWLSRRRPGAGSGAR